MAVTDFREGGFVFSRRKVQRDFSYDQADEDDRSLFAADPDGRDSLPVRLGRLTHYLGALASVGLMAGLVVWGFQLVSRDVSGVPVIRALTGDARTTPEDPGGELASYTGFAVNQVASGAPLPRTDRVAIAPDATGLTRDDVAMGQLGATAHEPLHTSDTPLDFANDPIMPLSDAEARARDEASRALQAATISDAPAAGMDPVLEGPVNEALTDETGAPAQADAIAAALAEAQAIAPAGTGLTRSSRPAPRPRSLRVAAAASAATVAPTAPARAASVGAVTPASGAPLVQVGAFDSNAIAQNEWSRLSGKFAALFAGKSPVIQQHQANGRTFWRLRVAGFDSRADAQGFCSAMKARGTDCMAIAAP